jgi:AraC-like DNA-binding protein
MSAAHHGILDPHAGAQHFTLDRHAPSADLAPIVDRYWIVRWDLRGAPPFVQETLPHPCVNLVVGTHQPGVWGVGTQRFAANLEGVGWALGVKFRPGGFHPFFAPPDGREIAELTGRSLAIADVFGAAGAALERDLHAADPDAAADTARIAIIEAFLRAREPAPDDNIPLVGRAVELAHGDPHARSCDLADRTGISPRTLERLFRRYVGVAPKWVIRRFRVHEACARVAAGAPENWSALAHELGYCDQAHFIRDFKAQVGRTPSDYAAACARS